MCHLSQVHSTNICWDTHLISITYCWPIGRTVMRIRLLKHIFDIFICISILNPLQQMMQNSSSYRKWEDFCGLYTKKCSIKWVDKGKISITGRLWLQIDSSFFFVPNKLQPFSVAFINFGFCNIVINIAEMWALTR